MRALLKIYENELNAELKELLPMYANKLESIWHEQDVNVLTKQSV